MTDPTAEPVAHTEHHAEAARVRRSPRYAVFCVTGAALGIIAALILTFAFDGTSEKSASTQVLYSTSQVFGFLALICVTIGIALGGVVALLIDRRLARRTHEVRIDRETVTLPEDDAAASDD